MYVYGLRSYLNPQIFTCVNNCVRSRAMASNSEKICEGASAGGGGGGDSPAATPQPVVMKQQSTETEPKNEARTKATRHPRWTRQETLVLIEAKKLVEGGEQLNRYKSPPGFVVHQTDPKWDLVSSLCQQQGVKRGAVQCRKRWGNLLTDYRKIKKWETGAKQEADSFWMMRNDKRKEKKLPGFFDSVVYNVLDGGVCTAAAYPLTLVKVGVPKQENVTVNGDDDNHNHQVDQGVVASNNNNKDRHEDDHDIVEEDETTVDSEMGWSTEEENNDQINTITGRNKVINSAPLLKTPAGPKETIMMGYPKMIPSLKLPGSEKPQQPSFQGNYDPGFQRERMSQDIHKRKRLSPDNCKNTTDLNNNIVKILRRNSNILKAHLGAQNVNYQLAREQQKEQTDSLVAALGKLTDAITKVADKL